MNRQIILHVGPTNSGKTYQALKRLENAESGIYCGPLRLLAHEIFEKMNENGFARFIFPENKDAVLEEMKDYFSSKN